MASAPVYFTVAKMAHARVTTGVTATDGSSAATAFTWYNTAPTADWMLVKITYAATSATGVGNPADSLIHIFVDDGTTMRCIRTIDIGDPAVGSTTVSEMRGEISFGPEFVFPSSVLPEVTVSVTTTAGNIDFVLWAQSSQ